MNTRTANTQQQPLRSLNMNSAFPSQASNSTSRQTPRLQNANKTGLGSGWGGFGMPSAGGGGGFGAPGFGGQARPSQLSGFAQVMGGGSGQGPIDMSDFPSLSGGPRMQSNANAASWNGNAIRQPSGQQMPQSQQQPQQRAPSAAPSQQSLDQLDSQQPPQQSTERSGGGEEFPPLGGLANGDAIGQPNNLGSGLTSPDSQQPRTNGQQTQLPIRETNPTYQQNSQHQLGMTSSQQSVQLPQNGQPPPAPSSVKKWVDMSDEEKWGLPGLMAAFEARRQADAGGEVDMTVPAALRSPIVMGHDLSALGLDLDSPEPLYPTFAAFPDVNSSQSTFDYHDRHTVPDFTLPSAYTVTNVPPLNARMSAFSDETLFQIFYQYPRDILQELASNELVQRDWRWHKVLRQWLQKDTVTSNGSMSLPLVDLTNGAPINTPPIRKSEKVEQGVFIFFDAANWRRERRYLDLDYESLDPPNRVPVGMNGAVPPGRIATEGMQGGSSQIVSA